jgi:hypothetical protein
MVESTLIVSQTPDVYSCFPDIVRTATGKLIVIFRESDGHSPTWSRVVIRDSIDDGHSWSDRRVLAELGAGELQWNCPRIGELSDGRLVAVCDQVCLRGGERCALSPNFIWFSTDGESWGEPIPTGCMGIVPDKILELPARNGQDGLGALLLATHYEHPEHGKLHEVVYRSVDGGLTWGGPTLVAEDPRYNLCEASIVRTTKGTLVAYLRENSGLGLPIFKTISTDDGRSWEGVYETQMLAGHRPVAGHLCDSDGEPDGRLLITYRFVSYGAAQNFFAALEDEKSALETDPRRQVGRVVPIDHCPHQWPDQGYSGWVNLPDGRVFLVQYFRMPDDMAAIRGYYLRIPEHFGRR